MSEELKLLFEDLHKNELSKVGKCNLELEIRNLIKQLQSYKTKEDRLIKWCYEHGQAIDATDILDIIDPKILNEGDK